MVGDAIPNSGGPIAACDHDRLRHVCNGVAPLGRMAAMLMGIVVARNGGLFEPDVGARIAAFDQVPMRLTAVDQLAVLRASRVLDEQHVSAV